MSAFRRRVGSSGTGAGHKSCGAPSRGVGVWVCGLGKAEQIKQILKSSWQLNKRAAKGCLSWLGV